MTLLTPTSFSFTGGYERFSSEYPEFCSKTKALATIPPAVPPSTAESLDVGCGSCGTPLHDQVDPGTEPGRKGQWEGVRRGQGGLFSEFCFSEALGPVPQFGENGVNPEYWGAVLGRVHLFLPSLLLPSFGNIQRPNFLTLPLAEASACGLLCRKSQATLPCTSQLQTPNGRKWLANPPPRKPA